MIKKMDFENGGRDKKYSQERKRSSYNDYKDDDDDDDDYNYKLKLKYKEKERDYREKDRNYKEKEHDYKNKDRRDKEKEYRDRREKGKEFRDRRDKDKEFRDFDKKDKIRERDRDKDRDRERGKLYKYKDDKDRDKRHHSRNRSESPFSHKRDRSSRSRSKSRSQLHYRSRSRSKGRSRSRSRHRSSSSSRHRSRSRQLPHSSLPPSGKWKHESKRYDSRSKDVSDTPFSHYKGHRKMMILEKLGIDLVVPENMEKSQTGNGQSSDSGMKPVSLSGELASYCNLTPANSKMILDRLNRKKLLWGNKTSEQKPSEESKEGASAAGKPNTTVWQSAIFTKDGDSKQTAKFKRLMGIKEDGSSESKPATSASTDNKDLIKRQEEMFQNMEMQYEVARASTHTHRGIGLGFGIHQYPR